MAHRFGQSKPSAKPLSHDGQLIDRQSRRRHGVELCAQPYSNETPAQGRRIHGEWADATQIPPYDARRRWQARRSRRAACPEMPCLPAKKRNSNTSNDADSGNLWLQLDVRAAHSSRSLLGGANSNGNTAVQTFGWASYIQPGIFNPNSGWAPQDIHALSHEIAEWGADPFVNHLVEPWLTPTAPQHGCTGILETGGTVVGIGFSMGSTPMRRAHIRTGRTAQMGPIIWRMRSSCPGSCACPRTRWGLSRSELGRRSRYLDGRPQSISWLPPGGDWLLATTSGPTNHRVTLRGSGNRAPCLWRRRLCASETQRCISRDLP